MRREDREVTGAENLLEILRECTVCRLGMADNGVPYVVPLNFGYEYQDDSLFLYFHGDREGKKIDILKKNNRVCFEMDTGHQLSRGDNACHYGFNYTSIVGMGTVEFIEEESEKIRSLNILMKHQTGENREFTYGEAELRAVTVYRLKAETFTGKRRSVR